MNDDRLNELKSQFSEAYSASQDMRDQSNEEYRFVTVPGAHWEGWLEADYEDRAKPQLNHVSAFCRRVHQGYLNNRPQVNYSPSDDTTTDEDAELLDGVYRRDLNRRGGQASIDTAVWEQKAAGFGVVILNTEYEDEGDPENEYQNIVFTEQPCAYSTVVFDPAAKRADKSDGMWAAVLSSYSEAEHRRKWPDAQVESIGVSDRSWFTQSSGTSKNVYVATHYEIKVKSTKIHTLTNPDEIDDKTGAPEVVKVDDDRYQEEKENLELFGFQLIRTRTVKTRSVYKTVYNGGAILEKETRVVGKYIPVIPFYGYRAWVDGVEHYQGVVREHMDPQRVANMSFALAAEDAAHSSGDKLLFSVDQVQNQQTRNQFAGNWHQAPYLVVDDVKDPNGVVTHRGPSAILPGTAMSPIAQTVMQMSVESMQMGMGGAPQEVLDPNSSGKAITAIHDRIDMNTDMVHDNTDQSTQHLGRVYESMASEVYGAHPNRQMKIITDRNEAKSVVLNKTVGMAGKITSLNDISRGKFDVVVNVSKDYQTENDETFEALRDIISVIPETDPDRPMFAKWLFLLKEGRGIKDLQKKIRNDLILKGWIEAQSDEEKQMLQQAQEQAANQPEDPDNALMQAAAKEQETQALLNQSKVAETQAKAVKTAKEAEKISIESQLAMRELQQPMARQLTN